jgi:branched-chain amino acid transport system substrate-binding protein
MQQNSTTMAVEEINAAGGVRGRNVQAVYEDDQALPAQGVKAFRKLIDVDKVPIVVGSPASNVTLAVAKIANDTSTVLLSSGSTAQAVGQAGAYVFRIMPSDEVQASIVAEWALELKYQTMSIIYVENAWGRGLADAFQEEFAKRGGSILTREATQQGATDFRAQIQNAVAPKPDAVFAPLYTKEAGLMIRQMRELGHNTQILGADVYETPELITTGGKAVDGVLYTTYSAGAGPKHDAFAKAYKEKYNREPEAYAYYCYDAIKIALKALNDVPEAELNSGASIRKSLLAIDSYDGVTGPTRFAGKNSASGKTFVKWMIKDGKGEKYERK